MGRLLCPGDSCSFSCCCFGAFAVHAQGQRLQIVASFTILADVAHNVAGDAADVTTLIPPDADPHAYTPAPSDLAARADADVVLVNGAQFEQGLLKTIASVMGDKCRSSPRPASRFCRSATPRLCRSAPLPRMIRSRSAAPRMSASWMRIGAPRRRLIRDRSAGCTHSTARSRRATEEATATRTSGSTPTTSSCGR